jgi:hypothetical protein
VVDTEFDYVVVGAGSAGCVLDDQISKPISVRDLLGKVAAWSDIETAS